MNKEEFEAKATTLTNSKVKFIDKDTMDDMENHEYTSFLQYGHLVSLDANGVLWDCIAHCPIATNKEQLNLYIKHLQQEVKNI